MTYITLYYFAFVAVSLITYYVLPLRFRWMALLASNAVFLAVFYRESWYIIALTAIVSWLFGLLISRLNNNFRKIVFVLSIALVVIPWFLVKDMDYILTNLLHKDPISWIAPIGISFYTMQIIAYLADIYIERIEPQRNPAKYLLFITFFPQIVQGPIPRYEQLGKQLYLGQAFDEDSFSHGVYLIIWGFFLKLVIADKAAVIVDTVFGSPTAYQGAYVWVASILYSIQLYTDFYSCTMLAKGVSGLFGIELIDNFKRPYLATSISDFWHRWHISLSTWLRDYIYIPLGGNRKGKINKIINLILTFAVSGVWHGAGIKYIFWGLCHGIGQVVGMLLEPAKNRIYEKCEIEVDSKLRRNLKRIGTFMFVNAAWVIFRSQNLQTGIKMVISMFTRFNPWILTDDSILRLGLGWKQLVVLLISIVILLIVGLRQENGERITDTISSWKLPLRWAFLLFIIFVTIVFGTYGYGYDAQSFIYGGF